MKRSLGACGAVLVASATLIWGTVGCGSDVQNVFNTSPHGGAGGTGGTGAAGGHAGSTPVTSNRVDVLLVVDKSRGMGEKEALLATAIPDLVNRFANPRCIEPSGSPAAQQPAGPADPCPSPTSQREFAPVRDMHLGVVSSALGDHGGDVCAENMPNSTNNDLAELLTRSEGGGTVPTYQSLGFLAWDPAQQLTPPGETDVQNLITNLSAMVIGAGSVGCGLESQLESWYRFLVEPDPYLTIEAQNGQAVAQGTDTTLLAQRKAFLRPDSLLIVLLLTDENDCSIRDGGQYYYAARANNYHLPRAQITCATDPASDCCRSCGQPAGDGCPPKGPECDTPYDQAGDPINLRCFDEKRRFGIDFLEPLDRYVTGMTAAQVTDRNGNLAPNPIFTDLDPSDGITGTRDPSLVFFAAIVGVPWQDLARKDGNGDPDLLAGLDANGNPVGGLQSAAELAQHGVWDVILGNLATYVNPTDPHMIESIDPRSALPAPTAAYMADPINGHEYLVPNRDDLQYACIFPLLQPVDCMNPGPSGGCECADPVTDNPLCQSPNGSFGTTQYFAKAYPGRRELALLQAMGAQGVAAPICPAQRHIEQTADYGLRPAISAVVEAVGPHL